ncbi:hypothetical protein NSP_14510 [Nodularia spumigena CCY9414]|nr:hypothetical protein NSP_14510 [Nodularia spumigena CCY9414]
MHWYSITYTQRKRSNSLQGVTQNKGDRSQKVSNGEKIYPKLN